MSISKYKISQQALSDLNAIWLYTFQKWSKDQADRYYNLIIEEIKFISVNFNAGKSYEHIRENYRASKVKSHLIFYKKIDNAPVEIVRILHERMDLKKRLKAQ